MYWVRLPREERNIEARKQLEKGTRQRAAIGGKKKHSRDTIMVNKKNGKKLHWGLVLKLKLDRVDNWVDIR